MSDTPLCPQCHQPAIRNGRRRTADGFSRQRYRCQRCNCEAYVLEPRRLTQERFQRFCRELAGEKVIYAAAVLGVSTRVVVRYRARLRRMRNRRSA